MDILLPENPPTLWERAVITKACQHSRKVREEVVKKCAADPAWFINMFGFTFSPNDPDGIHDLPFILYDFQIDYVRWLHDCYRNRRDGLAEKSRDMGISWTSIGFGVWGWLFESAFQALIGSRKEDLVDNWNMDSLFGKIEYFVRSLPGWILPLGFDLAKHRTKLKLVNPENGNAIQGESANSEFSRSGRYRLIIYDELAFWADILKSWRAGGAASPCRIGISTPSGYNQFYRMVQSGQYSVMTIAWHLHPDRDEDWYTDQQARYAGDDVGFAQEIDISYDGSVEGVVYPIWEDVPQGVYPYESGMPLFTGIDLGLDGVAITWVARNPRTSLYRIVDYYEGKGKPIDYYVPLLLGYVPDDIHYDYPAEFLQKVGSHALWGPAVHFADPSVRSRNVATGISAADVLREYGIHVKSNTKRNDFKTRKAFADRFIRQIEGVNENACWKLNECMQNARFPERSADSQSTSKITNPIHDWTSHGRTTIEFIAVNLPRGRKAKRKTSSQRPMAYNRI